MKKIFVSYKRINKDRVFKIVNEIKQRTGVDCWVDLEGIESGDWFENVIIKEINKCDILLFMLSRESILVPSEGGESWTQKEVKFALRKGKRVIPILIDGTTIDDCDWLSFNCSGIDSIDYSNADQWNKFLQNLCKWCGTKFSAPNLQGWEDFYDLINAIGNNNDNKTSEGLTLDKSVEGKWGYKDIYGKQMIPYRWKNAKLFSEGLAAVENDDRKWGYINKSGKIVIPCQWDNAEEFSEGLAAVKGPNDNAANEYTIQKFLPRYGYIDKTGKKVVPCEWFSAYPFHNGEAEVMAINGQRFYIDRFGNILRKK